LWEGLTNGQYSTYPQAAADARRGAGSVAEADRLAGKVRGGSDALEGRSDQGMWNDPGHRAMHAPGAAPGTGINALGQERRLKFINGEWYSDKVTAPTAAVAADRARQASYDASAKPTASVGNRGAFRAELNRSAMTAAQAPVVSGQFTAEIKAPTGTKVEVTGSGAFSEPKTTRETSVAELE
jgi:hypothetical protein